jgi:hypothetical protein
MVTSSIITALSWQVPPAAGVEPGVVAVVVPGVVVVVVDGSGVDVSAVAVGRDRPGRVGGSVEVTKGTGVRVAAWGTTFTHEAMTRLASRIDMRISFMQRFYFGILKPF